jgi:hypothetical protein
MWFLPSRGRPDKMLRFIEAYKAMKSTTPVMVRLDRDDPLLGQYLYIPFPDTFWVCVGETDTIPNLTRQFVADNPDLPWYGLLGDDVVPCTEIWDQRLVSAAGLDKVAYCVDDVNNDSHMAHGVIGGEFMRSLSYLGVPGANHFYLDTMLFVLAKQTHRAVYLPDVELLHLHFSTGQAEMDETYKRTRFLANSAEDQVAFNNWISTTLEFEIKRIEDRIGASSS